MAPGLARTTNTDSGRLPDRKSFFRSFHTPTGLSSIQPMIGTSAAVCCYKWASLPGPLSLNPKNIRWILGNRAELVYAPQITFILTLSMVVGKGHKNVRPFSSPAPAGVRGDGRFTNRPYAKPLAAALLRRGATRSAHVGRATNRLGAITFSSNKIKLPKNYCALVVAQPLRSTASARLPSFQMTTAASKRSAKRKRSQR